MLATSVTFDTPEVNRVADDKLEEKLLRLYHAQLLEQLVHFGKAKNIADAEENLAPWRDFLMYFDMAFIDILPVIIGYHWKRIQLSPEVIKKYKGDLNKSCYNKSLRHACWLTEKLEKFSLTNYQNI